MNKIQKLSFRTVSDFMAYLPDDELMIVQALRDILLETIPAVTEKLSYNVPFYKRHFTMAYIWPAAVPWGNVENGVIIGFSQGNYLHDDSQFLETYSRKKVATHTYHSTNEIDRQQLESYISQAIEVDDYLQENRKK